MLETPVIATLPEEEHTGDSPSTTSNLQDQPHPHDQDTHSMDPALGVLLVHGIGSQKRGETITWQGDSLVSWLKAWLGRRHDRAEQEKKADHESIIYLTGTRLVRALSSERCLLLYSSVAL